MEIAIKKIRTVFFTKNLDIALGGYNKGKLLEEIGHELGDIFNGEPLLIPLPGNVPPEFPRIILNSSDNLTSCNISLSRTEFAYTLIDKENISDDTSLYVDDLDRIFNFLKKQNAIVNRVGFIADLEINEKDSLEFIRKEFIKDDKFDSLKELTIRLNSESLEGDSKMNNLVMVSGKKGESVIKSQIDINTVPEDMNNLNIDGDKFKSLAAYSIKKIQNIIENFPNI